MTLSRGLTKRKVTDHWANQPNYNNNIAAIDYNGAYLVNNRDFYPVSIR
jgi:hypothetical protein